MEHLKVKKIRRGYIVVNTKTGNHTHMKSKYGCFLIKKFIRKKIYPDNPYMQESYRRLMMTKKKHKDRYINVPVKEYRHE